MNDGAYGELIRLDRAGKGLEETLHRIPLGTSASDGGMDESTLQDLLFRHPQALPIASIDASYDDVVPVCKELHTPAGYVDAIYVNALGRLTLAEFKLWRNPQARREVIGQILDYAKELASWSYEDLQREVSKSLKRKGNVLHELVSAAYPEVDEAAFVDNVSRHLKRGEFLLLIIGDGIREDAKNIVDFVQEHGGLHFNLALIEAALYRDKHDQVIVQPRIVTRTELVPRYILNAGEVGGTAKEVDGDGAELTDLEQENRRFWAPVLEGLTLSDVSVDMPNVSNHSVISFKGGTPEFGNWVLRFNGFLQRRSPPCMGCYLTCDRNNSPAMRVFESIKSDMDALRAEMGEDLEFWHNKDGLPRLGFFRPEQLPFGKHEESGEFRDSVQWMQEKLDLLVSAIHPRLQRLLGGKD